MWIVPPILWVIAVAVLAAPVVAEDEKPPAPRKPLPVLTDESGETWYAEAFTKGPRGVLNTHYWSKGPLFRAEVVIAGRPILTLVNGDYYYTVDTLAGRGVAVRRAKLARSNEVGRQRPFGNEADMLLKAGAEKVRTERLGGRECDLYRLTNSLGRRSVCVSQDSAALPIQILTFNRATGFTEDLSYLNWLSGFEIKNTFFEPDPRWELEVFDAVAYQQALRKGPVGPAPALFGFLLWGQKD